LKFSCKIILWFLREVDIKQAKNVRKYTQTPLHK